MEEDQPHWNVNDRCDGCLAERELEPFIEAGDDVVLCTECRIEALERIMEERQEGRAQ